MKSDKQELVWHGEVLSLSLLSSTLESLQKSTQDQNAGFRPDCTVNAQTKKKVKRLIGTLLTP